MHGLVFGSTGIQAGLNNLQHDQQDMKLANQVGSGVAVYFANEADSRVKAFSVQLYSVTLSDYCSSGLGGLIAAVFSRGCV